MAVDPYAMSCLLDATQQKLGKKKRCKTSFWKNTNGHGKKSCDGPADAEGPQLLGQPRLAMARRPITSLALTAFVFVAGDMVQPGRILWGAMGVLRPDEFELQR